MKQEFKFCEQKHIKSKTETNPPRTKDKDAVGPWDIEQSLHFLKEYWDYRTRSYEHSNDFLDYYLIINHSNLLLIQLEKLNSKSFCDAVNSFLMISFALQK